MKNKGILSILFVFSLLISMISLTGGLPVTADDVLTPAVLTADTMYKITYGDSGLALASTEYGVVTGAVTELQTYVSELNQLWEALLQSDGSYKMRNVSTGKYLQPTDAGAPTGSAVGVHLKSESTTGLQKWSISEDGAGKFVISTAVSQKILGIAGAASKGTDAQLNDTSANGKWILTSINRSASTVPTVLPLAGAVDHSSTPEVVRQGDTYYMHVMSPGLGVKTSKDLVNWTYAGRCFPRPEGLDDYSYTYVLPFEWMRNEFPENEILAPGSGGGIWAPGVYEIDGVYYLYYSISTSGSQHSAIGVATNTTLDVAAPEYEWVDGGMVIKSTSANDYNCIDPNIVKDDSGEPWLIFGSYWNGVYARKIDRTTGLLDSSNPTLHNIAGRPNLRQQGDDSFEAPFMVKRDGYYYLFSAAGRMGSYEDYDNVVARSTSITGPFVDKEGRPSLYTGYNVANAGGTKVTQSKPGLANMGHSSVFKDAEGQYYLISEHLETGVPSRMAIGTMMWDAEGWPVVATTPNVLSRSLDTTSKMAGYSMYTWGNQQDLKATNDGAFINPAGDAYRIAELKTAPTSDFAASIDLYSHEKKLEAGLMLNVSNASNFVSHQNAANGYYVFVRKTNPATPRLDIGVAKYQSGDWHGFVPLRGTLNDCYVNEPSGSNYAILNGINSEFAVTLNIEVKGDILRANVLVKGGVGLVTKTVEFDLASATITGSISSSNRLTGGTVAVRNSVKSATGKIADNLKVTNASDITTSMFDYNSYSWGTQHAPLAVNSTGGIDTTGTSFKIIEKTEAPTANFAAQVDMKAKGRKIKSVMFLRASDVQDFQNHGDNVDGYAVYVDTRNTVNLNKIDIYVCKFVNNVWQGFVYPVGVVGSDYVGHDTMLSTAPNDFVLTLKTEVKNNMLRVQVFRKDDPMVSTAILSFDLTSATTKGDSTLLSTGTVALSDQLNGVPTENVFSNLVVTNGDKVKYGLFDFDYYNNGNATADSLKHYTDGGFYGNGWQNKLAVYNRTPSGDYMAQVDLHTSNRILRHGIQINTLTPEEISTNANHVEGWAIMVEASNGSTNPDRLDVVVSRFENNGWRGFAPYDSSSEYKLGDRYVSEGATSLINGESNNLKLTLKIVIKDNKLKVRVINANDPLKQSPLIVFDISNGGSPLAPGRISLRVHEVVKGGVFYNGIQFSNFNVWGAAESGGDINDDGIVNAEDIVEIKKNILGMNTFGMREMFIADLSGDELIGVSDAILIKRKIVE